MLFLLAFPEPCGGKCSNAAVDIATSSAVFFRKQADFRFEQLSRQLWHADGFCTICGVELGEGCEDHKYCKQCEMLDSERGSDYSWWED